MYRFKTSPFHPYILYVINNMHYFHWRLNQLNQRFRKIITLFERRPNSAWFLVSKEERSKVKKHRSGHVGVKIKDLGSRMSCAFSTSTLASHNGSRVFFISVPRMTSRWLTAFTEQYNFLSNQSVAHDPPPIRHNRLTTAEAVVLVLLASQVSEWTKTHLSAVPISQLTEYFMS